MQKKTCGQHIMKARDVFLLQVKFFKATFINNFAYVAVVVAKENVSLKRYDCVISVSSLKIIILLGVKTNKQLFFKTSSCSGGIDNEHYIIDECRLASLIWLFCNIVWLVHTLKIFFHAEISQEERVQNHHTGIITML